jgi:putative membrane protein
MDAGSGPSPNEEREMIVLERPNALKLFFTMRGSVLPRITPSLATCTGLALVISLSDGFLFEWKVTLTPVPFTLIGLALAIFLGFRNSAAYERFWEGRKLWGDVIHRSRTLARQVVCLSSLPSASTTALREGPQARVIHRTIAFAHALRHRLRDTDAGDDVAKWLTPDERLGFQQSRLGAEYLLRRSAGDVGAWLRDGHVCAPIAAEMDRSLAILAAAQAGCERIKTTPIPFAYTLLLHRTAYAYCFLLPFGLIDTIGLMTPFVVAIVAYTFFGLDAVGDEIEQPFGTRVDHLPLDALCRTIETDLLEALGVEDLPPRLLPQDGCLL